MEALVFLAIIGSPFAYLFWRIRTVEAEREVIRRRIDGYDVEIAKREKRLGEINGILRSHE
jgi:hypothetical protein